MDARRASRGLTLIPVPFLAGLCLLASVLDTPAAPSDLGGPDACQACHGPIHASFIRTAHFQTSRVADRDSIKGSFSTGANVLRTRNPNIHFEMKQRGDGFYQTAHRWTASGLRSTTERFDRSAWTCYSSSRSPSPPGDERFSTDEVHALVGLSAVILPHTILAQ